MTAEDTSLALAFSGAGPEAHHALDHAKRIGAPRILITDAMESTLVNMATVTLFITRGQAAAFHSLHVPVVLADALVLAIANQQGTRALRELKRLQVLRRYGAAHSVPVRRKASPLDGASWTPGR